MNVIYRVIAKVKSKVLSNSSVNMPQLDLEMILPPENLIEKEYTLDPDYALRQYEPRDYQNFMSLIAFSDLAGCSLQYWDKQVLPDGFFIIIHEPTGKIVGACMAAHHPKPRHPLGACLGWLAVDPAHRGKGIGAYLTGRVMNRIIQAGYKRVFLGTQDFRLSAIKTYLRLGWVPYLYDETMKIRWHSVCKAIDWPYRPEV